jgi:hypothetical protein
MKKLALHSAVAAALGTAGMALSTQASAIVADGNYDMVINNTPYVTGVGGIFGSDGAWNSSFTFGCTPGTKGCGSQYMYDNGSTVLGLGGIAGDGVAGIIDISVSGGGISVNSFSVDAIFATAGGTFVQGGPAGGMSGSIAGTTMTFDPTGRIGAVSGFPALGTPPWNIDDFSVPGSTTYQTFSTGTATAATGTINGAGLVNIGDVNGDLVDDYSAILVSAGQVGSAWGGFFGATYFEAWNVSLLSKPGTTPIPVPAAVWLFGSGLLGLVGVARRKKQA